MNKPKTYKSFIFAMFMGFSCNQPEEITVYDEHLIFPHSFEITVEDYSFDDKSDGNKYFVIADSIADTLGTEPCFRWVNKLNGVNTIAISNEPLVVENYEIVNKASIIWQWHTGMVKNNKDTTASFIEFSEGRQVFNKKILYETQPLPLQNGLYFWAVWKWDKTGKRIIASTEQYSFVVDK
ncbi:MAG: hypothetical protein JXA77_02240 [Bacteroidales bacterium]|nr:hypothetical protein [Bacteroidales bacterium]MBN2817741.1 hypothetical protein [Bacteroidales bacterium]